MLFFSWSTPPWTGEVSAASINLLLLHPAQTIQQTIKQAFPTDEYESETTVRPAGSSWTQKTTSFIASLRDAGTNLLRGSSSKGEACRSFFAACPMDYRVQQDHDTDPSGSTNFLCMQGEAPSAVPGVHVFNVTICKGPARLRLTVRTQRSSLHTIHNACRRLHPDVNPCIRRLEKHRWITSKASSTARRTGSGRTGPT